MSSTSRSSLLESRGYPNPLGRFAMRCDCSFAGFPIPDAFSVMFPCPITSGHPCCLFKKHLAYGSLCELASPTKEEAVVQPPLGLHPLRGFLSNEMSLGLPVNPSCSPPSPQRHSLVMPVLTALPDASLLAFDWWQIFFHPPLVIFPIGCCHS